MNGYVELLPLRGIRHCRSRERVLFPHSFYLKVGVWLGLGTVFVLPFLVLRQKRKKAYHRNKLKI